MINNETFEGEILKDKIVRGFSYSDENGVGYIYPLNEEIEMNENDEDLYQYEVKGKCTCCMECIDDGDCNNDEYICRGNKCLNKRVVCQDNNDCKSNEICNFEGKCIKGCKNNDDCGREEICDWNGKCIKEECLGDGDCKNGELCISNQCSTSGCRDNFDCDNYDSVCIDNNCVFIGDSTESCSEDIDCLDGYFCDFEYFICVPKRKTMINRRKPKILSSVCSLYGILTLFIITTSYSIATKLGHDKLNDECIEKCSERYLMADYNIQDVIIDETAKVLYTNHKFSKCTGSCRPSKRLLVRKVVSLAKYCYKKEFTFVLALNRLHDANQIFKVMLTKYCRQFRRKYDYNCLNKKLGRVQHEHKEANICSSDVSTVKCTKISKYSRY